jgi:hypothetical protein
VINKIPGVTTRATNLQGEKKKKDGVTEKYSHDEKTIKHLYGVERSQDDLPLSLQGPFAISSYNEL